MIIAQEKKQNNIVEYLLYMWQIEDLIRAYDFDLDRIERDIISQFDVDDDTKAAMKQWYDSMITAMKNEGIEKQGHLKVLQGVLSDLTELHGQLMKSPFHQDYQKAYNNALPFLAELRQKSAGTAKNDLELALEALYGVLLLRLQGKQISDSTQQAIDRLSDFLSLLAKKYHDREREEEFLI